MPRLYRKVIRIRAEDSPNVRYGLAQKAAGLVPDDREVVPGVLRYSDYVKRRATWDVVRATIGLDGLFYEGAQLLLFPPGWLDNCLEVALALVGKVRKARAIGCDPAEGGDKTSMAAVDEFGLIELVSRKTPDTTDIPVELLAFMQKHEVQPEMVCIDRGGGGKQAADFLAKYRGIKIRTVGFGETLTLDPKRGLERVETRIEAKEERYEYVNRRAQMYGNLSELCDPTAWRYYEGPTPRVNPGEVPPGAIWGFGIPEEYHATLTHQNSASLRDQLAKIPRLFDPEGRIRMLPKNKRAEDSTEKTLVELIGHSPDEADAVVLAVHAMLHKKKSTVAGAF